eukprot:m.116196 g.116196  ORF g.116196 m.116196 type:complete len:65 (+) comp9302_c0_seq8:1607-1801(+)
MQKPSINHYTNTCPRIKSHVIINKLEYTTAFVMIEDTSRSCTVEGDLAQYSEVYIMTAKKQSDR